MKRLFDFFAKWFKPKPKRIRISRKAKMQAEFDAKVSDLLAKVNELESKQATAVKYLPVQVFDSKDKDFVREMSQVAESKQFIFYLVDSREKFFEIMRQKEGEGKLISHGYIEAVDLILKELVWFRDQYRKMSTNV